MVYVRPPTRACPMSTSLSATERTNLLNDDALAEFPLPPSSPVFARPGVGVNTHLPKPGAFTSPVSAPATPQVGRVLNTVGMGPRPRQLPRTGTGMVYRNSSYSSYYETSRISRTSVASSGKEVGVI